MGAIMYAPHTHYLVPSCIYVETALMHASLTRFLGPFLKDRGLSLDSQINNPLNSDSFTINNVDLDPTTMQDILSKTGLSLKLQSASLDTFSLRIEWPPWSLSWDNYVPTVNIRLQGIRLVLAVTSEHMQPVTSNSNSISDSLYSSTRNIDLASSIAELADEFARNEGSASSTDELDHQLPGAFASQPNIKEATKEPDRRGLFAGLIEKILAKLSFEFEKFSIQVRHGQAELHLTIDGGSTAPDSKENLPKTLSRIFQMSPPTIYFKDLTPQPPSRTSTPSASSSTGYESLEANDDMLMSQAIADLRMSVAPPAPPKPRDAPLESSIQHQDYIFLEFQGGPLLPDESHVLTDDNPSGLDRLVNYHEASSPFGDTEERTRILFVMTYTPPPLQSNRDATSASIDAQPGEICESTSVAPTPNTNISSARNPQYKIEICLPILSIHVHSPSEIELWKSILSDLTGDSSDSSASPAAVATSSHTQDKSAALDINLYCRQVSLRVDCSPQMKRGYTHADMNAAPKSSLELSLKALTFSQSHTPVDRLNCNTALVPLTDLDVAKITIVAKSTANPHESVILQVPASDSVDPALSIQVTSQRTQITSGYARFDIGLELYSSFQHLFETLGSQSSPAVDVITPTGDKEHVKYKKRSNLESDVLTKAPHSISFSAQDIVLRIKVNCSKHGSRNKLDYREDGVSLGIALQSVQVDHSAPSGFQCTVHSIAAELNPPPSTSDHRCSPETTFLVLTPNLDPTSGQAKNEEPCITVTYGSVEHSDELGPMGCTRKPDPATVKVALVRIMLNKKRFDRLQYWLDDLSTWAIQLSNPYADSIAAPYVSDIPIQDDVNCRSASLSPVSSLRSVRSRPKPLETTLSVGRIELKIDLSQENADLLSPSAQQTAQLMLTLQDFSISQTTNRLSTPQTTSDHSSDTTLVLVIGSIRGTLEHEAEVSELIRLDETGNAPSNMNRCAVSITIRTTGSLANSSSKTIMVDLVVRGIILHIGPQFTWIRDLLEFVKAPPGAFETPGPNYLTRVRISLRSTSIRVSPPPSSSSDKTPQFILAGCFDDFGCNVKLDPSSSDVSPEIQGTLTLLLAEGQSSVFVRLARFSNLRIGVSYSTETGRLRGCVHNGSLGVSLCADSTESLGDVIAGLGRISLTEQKPEVELDYDHAEEPSQSQEDLQASLLKSAIQDTRFRKPLLPFELGEDLVHEDYPSDANFVQTNSTRTGLKTKLTDSHLPSIIRNLHPDGLNIIDDFLSLPPTRSKPSTRVIVTEFKVENFDVSIGLHEGYDWASTRHAIEEAKKAMRKRLQKLRQLLAKGHSDESTLDEELPSTTLFKSVHFGLPPSTRSLTTAQLLNAIDRELDDPVGVVPNEDVSITGSWQTLPPAPKERSGPTINCLSTIGNLQRSRHPALEFVLNELTCRFRVYDPSQNPFVKDSSSESLMSIKIKVNQVSILDNIKTSTWKKFLTELRPNDGGNLRSTGSPMLRVKFDLVDSPDEDGKQEAILKLKIVPLRLYVDQDAVDFLKTYFGFQKENHQLDRSLNEKKTKEGMFFQRVEIFPIRIKLDYKPKRVDYMALQKGQVIELMNFFHFDGSDMTLRHAVLIGVPGPDKIGSLLQEIWTPDIKANQLADVISGISPVRSIVNLGTGLADLILLPIEEIKRKDGRISRGLQKGSQSFAKSTALEAIKLGAKLATGTQVVLEKAEMILGAKVSEEIHVETIDQGIDYLDENYEKVEEEVEILRSELTNKIKTHEMISRYADQPENLKMGAKLGYQDLRKNMRSTAQTILAIPLEVFNEGSGRAVVKAVPIAILHPMIGATGAISKTLLGLRHTLDPLTIENDEDKYKRLKN
ncbi:uncharacterized protein MELLADRAFT_92084 [Melampsora larici-populina 98AG31]|uniref:Autophagy-related protein 2 n=1 Tax=Melampsora larici-populina (strain 98AG31 / pathotype 3-4-7) TaxID=747676 RepID=F4S1G5_MELLP|nr:uncharacterized protein MELLADRAFT_92084 [Melampsora larici-populina 98AG31]EGG01564.1 hypothetical protein MELLADRAFT_92084 [Melampsora larici-populina 98AG31]